MQGKKSTTEEMSKVWFGMCLAYCGSTNTQRKCCKHTVSPPVINCKKIPIWVRLLIGSLVASKSRKLLFSQQINCSFYCLICRCSVCVDMCIHMYIVHIKLTHRARYLLKKKSNSKFVSVSAWNNGVAALSSSAAASQQTSTRIMRIILFYVSWERVP